MMIGCQMIATDIYQFSQKGLKQEINIRNECYQYY